MTRDLRVVFLGNHDVGIQTLIVLLEEGAKVVGVVAHPPDPEEGSRYGSVFEAAVRRGLDTVRLTGRDPRLATFVADRRPDLIWLTDYRYLVPAPVLTLAPLGAVNLHPSLLPRYRGRAPVNWAILNGDAVLGLTAHYVDDGMDSGDIIEQVDFQLPDSADVGDALDRLYPLYRRVTSDVLAAFRHGPVARVPQDHGQSTVFPARRPDDGLIDWAQPSERVRDLVRAVSRPYPGAFTFHRATKLFVWAATLEDGDGRPGEILSAARGAPVVATGEGAVALVDIEIEGTAEVPRFAVGEVLGGGP